MSSTITETRSIPSRVVGVSDTPTEGHEFPSMGPADKDEAFQSLARGDRAGTLKLRGIPIHTDVYAKRKWMKEHMAAAFRFFGKQGYGEGVSGHISMRGTKETATCHPASLEPQRRAIKRGRLCADICKYRSCAHRSFLD